MGLLALWLYLAGFFALSVYVTSAIVAGMIINR